MYIISADFNFHQYGSDEDWDKYAKATGDPRWASRNTSRYFTATSESDDNLRYTKLKL